LIGEKSGWFGKLITEFPKPTTGQQSARGHRQCNGRIPAGGLCCIIN